MTWSWTLPPHFPTGKQLRVKLDGGGTHEVALDRGQLTVAR